MAQALGLLILSFIISSLLFVPYIDRLYEWNIRRKVQKTKDAFNKKTPIFDKFHNIKAGTPITGGLLVIIVVTILTLWSYGILNMTPKIWELFVLLFAFLSFGVLGALDDLKKVFGFKKEGFFGLRLRHKLMIQFILALIISLIFYFKLGYTFVYIHWLGMLPVGPLFVLLAAFVIVAFTNAFNITDGLDGLSSGLLMICLTAFWAISATLLDATLGVFIAIWLGALISFLYFNVYPARIMLGDVGALSFGATLAVVGLLTGKILAIAIIGGIFVIEVASSLLQLLSKKFRGKKLFPVSPLHLLLQYKGWEEPKIVMRLWLIGVLFAILGLWIAVI